MPAKIVSPLTSNHAYLREELEENPKCLMQWARRNLLKKNPKCLRQWADSGHAKNPLTSLYLSAHILRWQGLECSDAPSIWMPRSIKLSLYRISKSIYYKQYHKNIFNLWINRCNKLRY